MSHSFNEFQRELNKYVTDQGLRYLFTLIYERLSENTRQIDETANLMITYAEALEKFANMHRQDQEIVGKLAKRAGLIKGTPGVNVDSVANEPE